MNYFPICVDLAVVEYKQPEDSADCVGVYLSRTAPGSPPEPEHCQQGQHLLYLLLLRVCALCKCQSCQPQ